LPTVRRTRMNEWAHLIWITVQHEFSDLNDVSNIAQVVIRLCVALVLGGVLGFEREMAGRDAGLRTHMLVATGSALFMLVPLQAGFSREDMSRVLQGLVSGIGFLGAGAIIKLSAEREVRGLTTAASLWLAAGVGVAAGLGREATAILSTGIALLILAGVRALKPSSSDRTDERGTGGTASRDHRSGELRHDLARPDEERPGGGSRDR
jgi:putative Mg2+ transporter-C (MgtC) family protein